jgi:hypothetical protein
MDKHLIKRITIDCVGFKKVEILELRILIETRFFSIKTPSARPGLVYSQLEV